MERQFIYYKKQSVFIYVFRNKDAVAVLKNAKVQDCTRDKSETSCPVKSILLTPAGNVVVTQVKSLPWLDDL